MRLASARVLLLLSLLTLAGPASPTHAEETPAEPSRIATMTITQLAGLVDVVTASARQDSLKLPPAARRRDCRELIRLSNAFALGYRYLGEARSAPAAAGTDGAVLTVRVKIVQARVMIFAARMRAAEWLKACAGFAVPEADRDDPRYRTPQPVAAADFAEAVADAHEGAMIQLAGAAAAARSGACGPIIAAGESMTLYRPYLEKLSADIAERPEVLGPRVSRRLLDADRARIVATEQALWQRFGPKCSGSGRPAPAP
jgi:hypothetical protein